MLNDIKCKNATCPQDRKYVRVADSGGLYLQVSPAGSKRWMWKYRFNSQEKLMALGSYPETSLAAARSARDREKLLKATGVDPMAARKLQKLTGSGAVGDTFKAVALEWMAKQIPQWSDGHAATSLRRLEREVFPWLGDRSMSSVTPPELLAVVRKVEARSAFETADRCLMLAGQIWRYGVSTGRVDRDISVGLKSALTPYRGKHFAAITDPDALAPLLRSIDAYKGGRVVRAALKLAPMLFQRPGELRAAAWSEINLDEGMWTIPAARMKREKDGKENGDPHLVPLPKQAVEILRELHVWTGHGALVFPGERNHEKPISENSVRTALIALGYTSEIQTWHGFRATARTMLAERLECDLQVIEAQLAHAVKDANGRAYNRTQYVKQRSQMMQQWADYLDGLKRGAKIISLKAA